MKWIIIILLFLTSCTKTVYVPVKGEDIIKTEYKEIVKDTIIYIPIEKDNKENTLDTTRDTVSVLMNRYSTSKAEVIRGHLKHTLRTKSNDSIPTKIIYKDILKIDSVYIEKPVIQEVEKPIRDNIFWYSIIGNIVFILLLAFKFARIIKKFISL